MNRRFWKLPRHTLPIGGRTLVMGVINLTPDSFSDGGRWFTRKRAWDNARGWRKDAVEILDSAAEEPRRAEAGVPAGETLRATGEHGAGVVILADTGAPYH